MSRDWGRGRPGLLRAQRFGSGAQAAGRGSAQAAGRGSAWHAAGRPGSGEECSVGREDGVEGVAAPHHVVPVGLGQVAEAAVEDDGEHDVVEDGVVGGGMAGAYPRAASSPLLAGRSARVRAWNWFRSRVSQCRDFQASRRSGPARSAATSQSTSSSSARRCTGGSATTRSPWRSLRSPTSTGLACRPGYREAGGRVRCKYLARDVISPRFLIGKRLHGRGRVAGKWKTSARLSGIPCSDGSWD